MSIQTLLPHEKKKKIKYLVMLKKCNWKERTICLRLGFGDENLYNHDLRFNERKNSFIGVEIWYFFH